MNQGPLALIIVIAIAALVSQNCEAQHSEERTASTLRLEAEPREGWATLSPQTRALLDEESPAELPGWVRPVVVEIPPSERKLQSFVRRSKF